MSVCLFGPYLFYSFFLKFIFIYLWLCWVFVSVRGLSLVVAIGGHSSSRCTGLSLSWPLLLRSTGSRRAGSVIAAHGPSCSAAYGIFPDQGTNPCPLHWQADSQPLRHQGSPLFFLMNLAKGYESLSFQKSSSWIYWSFFFFLSLIYFWSLLYRSFCWVWALFVLLFLIPLCCRLSYLFEIFLFLDIGLYHHKFPYLNCFCCIP